MLCIISACTKTPLEQALQEAGENRKELEKVLAYYQQDSLKLKAAQYLIENMPYHYSYVGEELEKYYQYFERFSISSWRGPTFVRDSIIKKDGAFHFDSLSIVYDIKTVKAEYLIHNIDFSFKIWREQPWGKKISFDNFLEYILPYRIGNEALTEWREDIYKCYNPLLDSIRHSPDSCNIKAVAQALMDSLSKGPLFFTGIFPYGPNVGPQLVKWRSGNCRELTDLVVYVFRALGLPGGCDKMLVRGDKNVAHYWNFIEDENGHTYFASIGQHSKNFEKANTYWDPKGKVYRETFYLNHKIIDELGNNTQDVPFVFRLPLMRDVTATYAGKINHAIRISVDSLSILPHEHETVYICMASNMRWIPVGYGSYQNDTVRVNDIEGAVVFRLAVCRENKLIFISYPFLLEKYNGNIRFFRPSKRYQKITLLQKFKEDFQAHMVGGVFEASNRPDFRWKDTLYQISERPPRLMNTVYLPSSKTYRYVRYFGPETRHCNISELSFYSSATDTLALQGTLLSPPGVKAGNIVNQFKNVFDGDPYTSLDYREPSGGWVGLDLHHPTTIRKIVYTPRNRDNFIRKGDLYELFYATESEWTSLGVQEAMADSLVYDTPENSLLYLKNHTRGNDERIFEVNKEGRQKLW